METISAETLKTNFVVTSEALVQIALIHEHDYTVTDKVFRLKIDGKECDGFRYFTGFTEKDPSDLTLSPLSWAILRVGIIESINLISSTLCG